MKKFLSILVATVLAFSTLATPVFAANTTTDGDATSSTSSSSTPGAAILTTCAQDSDGVGCILKLVVDIMSIGIGVLGVIGITVVGIQYLTAGGDEGKTKKAKQRMFEIVIGLVAYVVIYAALRWLLPSFNGV